MLSIHRSTAPNGMPGRGGAGGVESLGGGGVESLGGTGGVESLGRGCESGGIGFDGTESDGTVSRGIPGGTEGSPTAPVLDSTVGPEPQEAAGGNNASQARAHTCRERRTGFTEFRIDDQDLPPLSRVAVAGLRVEL